MNYHPVNWSYIAGILDGEGSIVLKDRRYARVHIFNNHIQCLNKIKDIKISKGY